MKKSSTIISVAMSTLEWCVCQHNLTKITCKVSSGSNQASLTTNTSDYDAEESSSNNLGGSVAKQFLELLLADGMPFEQVLNDYIKNLCHRSHKYSQENQNTTSVSQITHTHTHQKENGLWQVRETSK